MGREAGSDEPTPADAVPHAPPHVPPHVPLRIDVSPALHAAGHEVHDLGFEGIPDDGPVLHPERDPSGPDDPLDFVAGQLPSD